MKEPRPPEHQVRTGEARRAVTYERQSAEALFLEHAEFVAQFLHRLGVQSADVDDVVQEVFIVAHRKGGYEPGPAKPRTWLAAIATRLAAASRRGRARRREDYDEVALDVAQAEGRGPAEAAEIAQSMTRVQQALDTLDPAHRAAFVLYEIEGTPCDEIATALGVPIGTVYSRLHHARSRFAEAHAKLADEPPAMRAVEGL